MILDDEIVAGMRVDDVITWYFTKRPVWIMDHEQWANAFISAGYMLPEGSKNHDDRFGIAVLNRKSLLLFVNGMSPFRVEAELLTSALLELDSPSSWEDLNYLFPSILLDFDSEKFFSMDREDYPYGKYLAGGWMFHYGNFLPLVPNNYRYWLVNGTDYFVDLYG